MRRGERYWACSLAAAAASLLCACGGQATSNANGGPSGGSAGSTAHTGGVGGVTSSSGGTAPTGGTGGIVIGGSGGSAGFAGSGACPRDCSNSSPCGNVCAVTT